MDRVGGDPRIGVVALCHPPPGPGPIRTGIPTTVDAERKSIDQRLETEVISKSSNQITSSSLVAQSEFEPPKNVLK